MDIQEIPKVTKASLDMDLVELEVAADVVQEEEMDEQLTNDISGLAL